MRCLFGVENQVEFFRKIKRESGLPNRILGNVVGVSGRSFGDWVNGKILPSKRGVQILSRKFKVATPEVLEEREEYWSGRIHGRKAALERLKIYGLLETPEGRRKGGLTTQLKRKNNPEYYKKWAAVTKNKFNKPKQSKNLAEFIGIVLGDGGLTRSQLFITLNSEADKIYISYVVKLIFKLFKYNPYVFKRKDAKAVVIVVTGVDFVDYLLNEILFLI